MLRHDHPLFQYQRKDKVVSFPTHQTFEIQIRGLAQHSGLSTKLVSSNQDQSLSYTKPKQEYYIVRSINDIFFPWLRGY